MTQRPVFHPVAAPSDVSDQELADFAHTQGVATMVKPVPANSPAPAHHLAQDAPRGPRRTAPGGPPSKDAPRVKKPAQASKPAPEVKLSVRIPDYVSLALNIRAASDRCTAKHLVLQGLKAIGLDIAEADLNPDERRNLYRATAE